MPTPARKPAHDHRCPYCATGLPHPPRVHVHIPQQPKP
jgi:hypothetical protein